MIVCVSVMGLCEKCRIHADQNVVKIPRFMALLIWTLHTVRLLRSGSRAAAYGRLDHKDEAMRAWTASETHLS